MDFNFQKNYWSCINSVEDKHEGKLRLTIGRGKQYLTNYGVKSNE